ncbi:GAF domain-containing protein [Nocardioides sp. Bht2]|uniref:GAF domain-containing protein n=1 Tax=Nocardioides sp. Bht2 TaxID=3392297 RepID=UPI0039B3D57C
MTVKSEPRAEIRASWSRAQASGIDRGGAPALAPLPRADVEQRREASPLAPLVPAMTRALSSALEAGHLMVVSDVEGRVLWRIGSTAVRDGADRLGFVPGSAWSEGNVGTNAIGTALVLGAPVLIRGAEHFAQSHIGWGCAASPVCDPDTGRVIGAVDVSGPSRGLHPAELGLVELAARVASLELREERRLRLDRLRVHATVLVSRLSEPALVVDRLGHPALASGLVAPHRVLLPERMEPGRCWLPVLGMVQADPLPDGWLLRPEPESAGASRLELDLRGDPVLRLDGDAGAWEHRLSLRHAELLFALALAGSQGRNARDLADDLFADPSKVVTVRAELSRLRRTAGSVVLSQPYRIAPQVAVTLTLPEDRGQLLPTSSAPVVTALRVGGAT